ncbi:MAG: hypothetical protein IGQ88_04480 [Gloeomargaritaceae cyanobacterium C42_A2020_066]|nr:hypothetical protein [Gloeomargaritaceae cyanobacterium C42_A2020_066]
MSSPPPYYNTVFVGSTRFIYSDGIFLQPQGNSYIVVVPPIGATVSYLPEGCNPITQDGDQYFDCSGIIYQPYFQDGEIVFQVVYVSQELISEGARENQFSSHHPSGLVLENSEFPP